MAPEESLREIAALLRGLLSTAPSTATEVQDWMLQADKVYDDIRERFPEIQLPDEIRHYLNDADIRARDSGYRDEQNRMMREIIGSLERGVIPRGRMLAIPVFPGLTLSFRRSCLAWLVGIAIIALGLCMWSRR